MTPPCGDRLLGIVTDRLLRGDLHYSSLTDDFGLCVRSEVVHKTVLFQFYVKLDKRVQHERETKTHESKENPHLC